MLRPTTVANRLRRPEQALEMSVRGGSFLDAGDYRPEGPPVRDFGGRWLTENVFGAIGQVLGGPS